MVSLAFSLSMEASEQVAFYLVWKCEFVCPGEHSRKGLQKKGEGAIPSIPDPTSGLTCSPIGRLWAPVHCSYPERE